MAIPPPSVVDLKGLDVAPKLLFDNVFQLPVLQYDRG